MCAVCGVLFDGCCLMSPVCCCVLFDVCCVLRVVCCL